MKVLLGLFQIKIYGRLTPGEPADQAAETLGSREVSTLLLNRSGVKDTGRYIEKSSTRPLFGAARLASELGVFVKPDESGDVRALVHVYGQGYLLTWPFTTWRKKREGFKPAAWLKRLPGTRKAAKPSGSGGSRSS